ncbi:acetyl/propionyl/methylcrotonyl-CoA carboxylase subunit alpha [Sphaerisporangium corydalis]|uniref:Acetyl/propionyl/methylcrotonyl-CoA carboxylase subunit alpha n=1 Tax=Sphaerisporangium corydalis TaxID=1441875 RepID=A0ABV9E854_9ACTN|nr:biotin carboxylase N-terminal domain-containing protein [Sphaerisporangium corydalis]
MIRRLLVANRAEVARRVFRTCRDLGIETVAVFSDADAASPHVAEADHAVRLPGVRPADTYLRADAVVAAALASGADAVHPGYGFLSENAAFARAVLAAGLTWVGPNPEAIAAMGSKIEAKLLMAEAGVPVLTSTIPAASPPGDGPASGPSSPEDGSASPSGPASPGDGPPDGTVFPVLVKASAGGGGRGMRVVRDPAELDEAVASARREALSAFGDGTVFVEPLLEDARHIEVQILADTHGTVWTLGERECSIQRRHQKVVEETPSPGVSPGTREILFEAAVRAAKAIGYVGAGTVEFLVKDGTVAFLEMNTRLQVEHPVTECVYGLDLVRLQIEIAEGAALPAEPPEPEGHAIEVRLYAEDPAHDWRPQNGTLRLFDVPGVDARFAVPPGGRGLRLDSGVETGSEIGVHYDPMLAKVIAWGPGRAAVARRLAAALARTRVHGLVTNRDLLVGVLRHEAFLAGDTHTGFLAQHGVTAFLPPGDTVPPLSALAAALALAAANRAAATALGGLPSGWRNVPSQPQRTAFDGPGGRIEVAYRLTRDGLRAEGPEFGGVTLVAATPEEVALEADGVLTRFAVASYPGVVHVDSPLGSVRLVPLPRLPEPVVLIAPGSLLAPMPGTVLRVEVTPGSPVAAGQPILTLEAMKMEHQISAPAPGVVTALNVAPGRQVEAGSVLAVIEEA